MREKLFLLFFGLITSFASAQIGIVQPPDYQVCSNFTSATFNLTSQTPAILGDLNPADYTVTFHASQAAATGDTNPIVNPAAYYGNSGQEIYVRVEAIADPSNFEVTNFTLLTSPSPIVYAQTFTTCDFDGSATDGQSLIDLEEVAEQIYSWSSINPIEMEIVFYETQADAAAEINALNTPYYAMSGGIIYARNEYYSGGCVTTVPITIMLNDCSGECVEPDDLTVTNITGTGATFSWTAFGDETQWEILVLYSGGPFPLPTMDGLIVDTNPVTLTGLECPEMYDVYIRSVCGATISDWSGPVTFSLESCNSGGFPEDIEACAVAGSACFNLTSNEAVVLAGLDAAAYTVTYHTTSADANANAAAIANPGNYCITGTAAQTIFMRVVHNPTGDVQILDFTISPVTIIMATTPLSPLVDCDEDGDGMITFDLTAAGAQIGTANPLMYYATEADAYTATNSITNVAAFGVEVGTLTSIFIRETVTGGCDIIHLLLVNALDNCNLSNVCAGANSLCNALGQPFPNTVGISSAEPGNDYGCLEETPNPTWFFLPVSAAGTISLMIEQGSDVGITVPDLDVDFVLYGPFTSPSASCGTLTSAQIVDCSYSSETVEYATIPNAMPGEFYLLMTTNYDGGEGYVRISDTGTSVGEIDCSGLRLNAFIDANANGTKDSGEAGFALGEFHYQVNDAGDIHHITAPSGVHRIYDFDTTNSYDISFTIDETYTDYYSISSAAYSDITIAAGAGMQEYLFPVTVTQAYNDLSVSLISNEAPRPGFTYTNTIVYGNLGSSTAASGTLTFTNAAEVTITNVSQTGIINTADGFTYSFTNLQPFETREITVTMQVPTIPTVALGDLLSNTVTIEPLAGDVSPDNNLSESTEAIIGSYDPNDKMESRGEQVLISEFTNDDYLYYTIRFENTGTASAINIRIADILDSQLDENTVEMIRASHDYTLERIDNQLTWNFENVQLPPTIEDPVGSHGYVYFRVKPDPGFAVGDIIPNTASIYFDFNPAIVTNTFNTKFVSALAVNDLEVSGFRMWPNPASNAVTLSLQQGTISGFTIYDVIGKAIMPKQFTDGLPSQTVDLHDINPGVYFVEIIDSNNRRTTKKLIIK